MVRRRPVIALLCAGVLTGVPLLNGLTPHAHAAPAPPRPLTGQTPSVVTHGAVTLRGHHNPTAPLTLDVGLRVHNAAQLDAIIAAASDPNSPQYGHYLTNARYMAQFAPTAQEVQAVRDWAASAGLAVTAVSPDNLLVTLHGTTRGVEHALGVAINDYSAPGRSFISNDRDPNIPANLDIRAISGLTTIHRFHTMVSRLPALRSGGYIPQDFRAAYRVSGVGDASGQTIGVTLWGAPLPQSDLDTFASRTGTARLVGGQAGANGVDWLPTNGGSSDTNELVETALDVEYAHGVAPNSHLKYWLGDCAYDPSQGVCNPSDTGLEQAISDAANDASVHVVSNSWGGGEAASASDPFVSNTTASFQHAASVGTTFYFSSGDSGADSGGSSLPSYPADSPYVVSVGGTSLNTGTSYAYSSESAWSGSGGGCSSIFARPSWQTGTGAVTCAGRAEPDVAADADPNTGADVYVQGSAQQIGGTSLAAPLWTGMAADLNRYLGANGKPLMGFSAPRLYQLANTPATYARDFHDVTSGNNGYPAGAGWDEATGWGSPNLANLAADWSGSGSAPTATSTPRPTTTPAATATTTPIPPTATTPLPPTATNTPLPPTATSTPVSPTATNTAVPTATSAPGSGGVASGTHYGVINAQGAADSYTFTPGVGGASTVGMCALSTADDFDLYVYSGATLLASSTTSSNCEWVSIGVTAGQTYTVQTRAYAGTGAYRSAWNVGGAQVVWNVSGSIGIWGGSQQISFPSLSGGAIALSTCGPAGTVFDLYLRDAPGTTLASSTSPSVCEAIAYTPAARGLFRLLVVSHSGRGPWTGTIKTY